MARTATQSTLGPGVFSTGNYIREEDAQEAQEALNFAHQNIRRMHLFVRCGQDGWGDSAAEVATHDAVLPNTSGAETRYRFRIWVDPDAESFDLGALVTFPVDDTDEVEVTITVGSTSDVLTFTATGVQTTTLATSATGTGLLTCTVATEHTSGTQTGIVLDYWYIQEAQPAIPAPPDE